LQPQFAELAVPQHAAFSDGAQHDACSTGGQHVDPPLVVDCVLSRGPISVFCGTDGCSADASGLLVLIVNLLVVRFNPSSR